MPPQLDQIHRGAHELPFAVDGLDAADGEPSVAAVGLEIPEDRLDSCLASGVRGGTLGCGEFRVHNGAHLGRVGPALAEVEKQLASPHRGDSHLFRGFARSELTSVEPSQHRAPLCNAGVVAFDDTVGCWDRGDEQLGVGFDGCVVRAPVASVGNNGAHCVLIARGLKAMLHGAQQRL